jgi:drug/metabolite transporter (DMT)-like permease
VKPRDLALLLLLAAIWGASFLFIRVAAPVLNPVVLVELRVLLAGVALLGYSAAMRRVPSFLGQERRYLALSALNAAIPFTLVATAALYLTASNVAILNATTALCTAVVAAVWRREARDRLTPRKVLGLMLGVVGVAVLVGWDPRPVTPQTLLAVGAVLLAALSYAFGAVYPGRYLQGAPPLALALGQQIGTGLLVLPAAVATAPARWPPATVVASVVALALVCTAFAYVLYFQLLGRIGPANTNTVTFLVPLFAVFWGVLVLREPLGPGTLAGLAIILASVGLVTGVRFGPRRSPTPTSAEPGGAAGRRARP